MILTVDIGNTSTTCGLFDGEKLVLQFRKETNIHSSSDEIGIFLGLFCLKMGLTGKKLKGWGCAALFLLLIILWLVHALNILIVSLFLCRLALKLGLN